MPLFLIERQFPGALELDAQGVADIRAINAVAGVDWLYSFLSADRRKTYCLYEAPNAQAIREAARRARLPADAIIEVTQVQPDLVR